MNCWEVLGIEPTRDHARIKAAYEQQEKFASGDDLERLKQAFREATGAEPATEQGPQSRDNMETQGFQGDVPEAAPPEPQGQETAELDASERQVVREVVIQIRALLNDSGRSKDAQIWKAILGEPPADQPHIRREIASALEPQVRPMAENGSFPQPVVQFLAGWFDWYNLRDVQDQEPEEDVRHGKAASDQEPEEELPPQMVNFWPAVIGWIVGLAILATLFGGMGGGG